MDDFILNDVITVLIKNCDDKGVIECSKVRPFIETAYKARFSSCTTFPTNLGSYLWKEIVYSGNFKIHLKDSEIPSDKEELIIKLSDPWNSQNKAGFAHISIIPSQLVLFYTQGRPLRLSLFQTDGNSTLSSSILSLALHHIARSGQQGITQSDLARVLSIDSKSLFHHLRSLLAYSIVVKFPVSYQKSFTYLLFLACFAPSDLVVNNSTISAINSGSPDDNIMAKGPKMIPTTMEIRQRILEAVQCAPSKTIPTTDLYKLLLSTPFSSFGAMESLQTGLTPLNNVPVKVLRRNISSLIKSGNLECFVAQELGGVTGRIIKYKKALIPFNITEKKPKTDSSSIVSTTISSIIPPPYGWALATDTPFEWQVHQLITLSGSTGLILSDLMRAFSIGRKLAYRLGERLTKGKLVITGSDIIKAEELVGRERRHRLFCRNSMKNESQLEEILMKESITDNISTLNTDIISIGTTNVASVMPMTITRKRRLEVLLQLITEARFVEVSRTLIISLQERLGEKDFRMDMKTLRRLILQLESEGKIRTIIVILDNNHQRDPTGSLEDDEGEMILGRTAYSRTILTTLDIPPDDPLLKAFIETVRQCGNKHEFNISTCFIEGQKDDQTNIEALSLIEAPHKYKLERFGFVYGVMRRCKLLHQYLINNVCASTVPLGEKNTIKNGDGRGSGGNDWIIETLSTLFHQIPLNLFLQLVGVGEMSASLLSYIHSNAFSTIPLSELPPYIREELHRRRVSRHKIVIKKLMELLGELGLVTPDNRYPFIAFRLPFQYRISKTAAIMSWMKGKRDTLQGRTEIARLVDLTNKDEFETYWEWLESFSSPLNAFFDGINDIGPITTTGGVYSLSKKAESWQHVSPLHRSVKRTIRKLIQQEHSQESGGDTMMINNELKKLLMEEYEINEETLANLVDQARKEVNLKRKKRLEKDRITIERRKRKIMSFATTTNQEKDKVNNDQWSEDEIGLFEDGKKGNKKRKRNKYTFLLSKEELNNLFLAYILLHRPSFHPNSAGPLRWSLMEALFISKKDALVQHTFEQFRSTIARLLLHYEHVKQFWEVERMVKIVDAAIQAGLIQNFEQIGWNTTTTTNDNDDREALNAEGKEEEQYKMLYEYYHAAIHKELINIPEEQQKALLESSPYKVSLVNLEDWHQMRRLGGRHQFLYLQDKPLYIPSRPLTAQETCMAKYIGGEWQETKQMLIHSTFLTESFCKKMESALDDFIACGLLFPQNTLPIGKNSLETIKETSGGLRRYNLIEPLNELLNFEMTKKRNQVWIDKLHSYMEQICSPALAEQASLWTILKAVNNGSIRSSMNGRIDRSDGGGKMTLGYDIVGNVEKSVGSIEETLMSQIQQAINVSNVQTNRFIWLDPSGQRSTRSNDIALTLCRWIYEEVQDRQIITRGTLEKNLIPIILTNEELDIIVGILKSSGILEGTQLDQQSGKNNYRLEVLRCF